MKIPNSAIYFGLLLCSLLLLAAEGLEIRQSLAIVVVLALVLGTVLFWDIRLAIALVGMSVLLASGLISIEKFIQFSSMDIIVFLAGMMLFVGYLEKNAFFEFLVGTLLGLIGGGGKRIVLLIMLLSAFFAAIVDEVTSILFMLSIVIHITSRLKVNPIPFVILTVFATNIGSSATAIGNPVGVMIALNAKLSFSDFLANAAPVSIVALAVGIAVSFIIFRKEILEFASKARSLTPSELSGGVGEHRNVVANGVFFFSVLAMLVMHAQIEGALSIAKNSMLLGTALLAGGVVLLFEGKNARPFVESKIDWWTLFFFMMLFASVGALEETGVMELAAKGLLSVVGDSPHFAMGLVMLLSGTLSAVLDNVLAVAVFTPLIHDLAEAPIGGDYLWWALLFGGTLFGNLTLIGSTANIVALGLIEKRGMPKITFMQWFKAGLPVVAATAAAAYGMLVVMQLGI